MRILGLSGSLRRGSFNTGLLQAAADLAPAGVTIEVRTLQGVPLYDGDLEARGLPEAVAGLRAALQAADGLLLSSPEYNNGIPGVFKNAVDWIGSGPGAELFKGKPVAVMGASPMRFGTMLAQDQWLTVLRALGARVFMEERLLVGGARDLFDDAGRLGDAKTRERVAGFVAGFAAAVGQGARTNR